MEVVRGVVFEADVLSAAYEGVSVAKLGDLVVFVRGGVPGDTIRGRIIKKKRRYAEAVVEDVLRPSEHRVAPACPYFGTCGGCSWQHTDPALQIDFKTRQVEELLQRVGGLPGVKVNRAIPSPRLYHYRNKMEFTFGARRWLTEAEIAEGRPIARDFALGLHIPQRFDRVLDLEECHLMAPVGSEILNFVRKKAVAEGWSAYDVSSHSGYLRNLVIRTSEHTGEILVNLVTSEESSSRMEVMTESLRERFPTISTVVNSVNTSRSPVAAGEEKPYHGAGAITERIGHVTYGLGSSSFFQPNSLQAERLYGVVSRFSRLTGQEHVLDLYCGVGGISLFIAREAAAVVGVENTPDSVEWACKNAEKNSISNCSFILADASRFVGELSASPDRRFQVVIADPPRSGMHPDLCQGLVKLGVQRIVYVSCNPATQARDLGMLSTLYDVEEVQPVDMFPHTYHIENVAVLRRRP